jgi:glycosyltransferase involved in cell wall biosynthesis
MQKLFSDKAIGNVIYLGSIPHIKIKEKIQSATLCVFPSFAEAFPVSWLEAMAMEIPIVASNVGWAKEMIDEGDNGFLAHPKDHDTFSKRITTLLNNEELCLKVGNSAREKVEKSFDIKVLARQNIEFYKLIIAKFDNSIS